MKARDVMTSDPIVVHKTDRIENVMDLMRKHNISKLPVVDDGHLVGVVSDGDVLEELGAFKNREISPSTLHVSTAMKRDVEAVGPDTDLKVVLEVCKREGVSLVPVVDAPPKGKLLGIITKADLLRLVDSEAPLEKLMKRTLHSVHPTDRLIHARRLMIDHGIERLPVIDAGMLKGILSEMDIALALDEFKKRYSTEHQKNQIKNLYVEDIMRREVVTGTTGMSAKEAATLMRKADVGGLPVVENGGKIQGMVTRTDLIRTIP